MIGIAVGARPIASWLRARRVPAALAEATAMTVAATIATAPLIALHFGRVSLVGLPANVLAAPAVAPVMWLGVGRRRRLGPGERSPRPLPFTALAALPAGATWPWLGHAAAHMSAWSLRDLRASLGLLASPAPPAGAASRSSTSARATRR